MGRVYTIFRLLYMYMIQILPEKHFPGGANVTKIRLKSSQN